MEVKDTKKWLCEFSVKKLVEEDLTEEKVVDGQLAKVTTKVKRVKPIKCSLLKPSGRMLDKGETFYAKMFADYIRAGLLSVAQVSKRYINDGGPFSDEERKRLEGLIAMKDNLAMDYWNVERGEEKPENPEERKKEIIESLMKVQKDIESIKNPYAENYKETAEYKAREKTINWWTVTLLHAEGPDGILKPMFTAKEDEEKTDQLHAFYEDRTAFDTEVYRKGIYLVSAWHSGVKVNDAEQLKSAEESYQLEFSDYSPEEDLKKDLEKASKAAKEAEPAKVEPTAVT